MAQKEAILKEQQHFFEKALLDPKVQAALRWLTKTSGRDGTLFERLMLSYDNPAAPLKDRLLFYPFHAVFEHLMVCKNSNMEMAKFKFFQHRSTLRALVNTARSIGAFGLTLPQKFIVPLMVVWNFTQACNLKCVHCYQDACTKPLPDEMDLEQKLRFVDEMADEYIPFLALAGGEPLMGRHFWEVLQRCRERHIHVTVASNGTMLTPETCLKLRDHGVKYVEISVDSATAERHDEFRGIPGAWRRAVDGIKNVVATPGMRAGLATCVSKFNVDEVDALIQMAVDLGCSTFVHFNYIPVGRGVQNDIHDLDPDQRELVLEKLSHWLQTGKIGIMSTAPQFGRSCYMHADLDGRMALGHAGSAPGSKIRVLAKYIGGCGSARCYCSVQPNGDVTPCVYIPHRIVGNLKEKSMREIWQHNVYFETLTVRDNLKDHCHICDYRPVCGGCRARADAYTGDILAGDPGCVLNRPLWDSLLSRQQSQESVEKSS